MNLLSCNQQYCLFSTEETTYLLENDSFRTAATLDLGSEIGHLQYGTGIAALVNGSKVLIYDFVYKKELYERQSFSKIARVAIFKNILIIASAQRILIHDLKTKSDKCYLPVEQGELTFFSHDYYSLKIAYFTDLHLITSREFWSNRMKTIEGATFSKAAYSLDGKLVALGLKNMLSIYCESKLLRLYGFESNVEEIVPLGEFFFVKLENNDILGCGEEKQVNFLEHQEIQLDFWTHDYRTVLMAGKEALYEMGKGVVRKYRLDRAQPCDLSDSKTMAKSMSSQG